MNLNTSVGAFGLDDEILWKEVMREALQRSVDGGALSSFKLFTNVNEMMNELTEHINICLIDYTVPPYTGEEIVKLIRAKNPMCLIIVLSAMEDLDKVIEIFHAGVYRFARKDTGPKLLKKLEGYISEAVADHLKRQEYISAITAKMEATKIKIDDFIAKTTTIPEPWPK